MNLLFLVQRTSIYIMDQQRILLYGMHVIFRSDNIVLRVLAILKRNVQ